MACAETRTSEAVSGDYPVGPGEDLEAVSEFPTDDVTLTMLIAACEINEETGRTHLLDFLDMGTRAQFAEDISHEVFGEEGGPPVYEVEYEEGYEPFSPTQVIATLARELMACRSGAAS